MPPRDNSPPSGHPSALALRALGSRGDTPRQPGLSLLRQRLRLSFLILTFHISYLFRYAGTVFPSLHLTNLQPIRQATCAGLSTPPRTTTAENPAIRCRCGRRVSLLPLREAAQSRFPVRLHSTTAEISAIRCRCGRRVSLLPLREAAQNRFPVRLHSTTAENPAIRCRCGRRVSLLPLREAAQNRFPVRLHSTTAENPAIQCRCGRPLRTIRSFIRSMV